MMEIIHSDEARWYVAQVKPNGFARAEANLDRQGFETFMPLRRKTVRQARQMREVLRPVFPGYLFIKFGSKRADWRKINSTFGVSKLISFEAGKPVPVPDALMAGLHARCDDHQILQPFDDLQTGASVRMLSGPFADFVGEVEGMVANDCVRLLFELMGQTTRVDVPQGDVERI
mgnify:CR=1 FL=1